MKRVIKSVTALIICGMLMVPAVDAQTRGRNNQQPSKSAPARTRPSTSGTQRPGGQGTSGTQRPGGQGTSGTQRPGGQGTSGTQRPGGQGTSGTQRPGGQGTSGAQRPGGQARPQRPGGTPAPGFGAPNPSYKPAPHQPGRPGMPPMPSTWHRPTPPAAWRPPVKWNPFRSLLGIALGSTINASINALINSGYAYRQYGPSSVCVYNVPMLNMVWPNAVLYYNNVGGLCGSRFVYTTSYYDMSRYYAAYTSLVNAYGMPYSVQNTANGIEANWWGTHNQYVSLAFAPQYTAAGTVSYYTTLSFGN